MRTECDSRWVTEVNNGPSVYPSGRISQLTKWPQSLLQQSKNEPKAESPTSPACPTAALQDYFTNHWNCEPSIFHSWILSKTRSSVALGLGCSLGEMRGENGTPELSQLYLRMYHVHCLKAKSKWIIYINSWMNNSSSCHSLMLSWLSMAKGLLALCPHGGSGFLRKPREKHGPCYGTNDPRKIRSNS